MKPGRVGLIVAVLALSGTAGGPLHATAAAQVVPVVREGRGEVAVDRRLEALLAGDVRVVSEDTQIRGGDTVRSSVLVLDASLILEGTILGDLVVVDGGVFVRPDATVTGDVVNVAGGIYRSEIAHIGGEVVDLPTAHYTVVREPDRLVIRASGGAGPVVLDGFYGAHIPLYDRVNGVTAIWGATLRGPYLGPVEPSLHVQAGWHTERGEPTYAGVGTLRRGPTSLRGGYEHAYDTNERWIRDDLVNSLNYLWDGDDYRDYHQVDRGWAGVFHEFGDVDARFQAEVGVRGQVEDAESLPGGHPWHILGDSVRPNPAVDDGRITSLVADASVAWEGRTTVFEGVVAYEAARSWLDGESRFDRVVVTGDWAMQALANHTLEIEFHGQLPLGGDTLPRQRWSFVGGSGTLQTADFGQFSGDRVAFVETKYGIPLPERLRLPLVGVPELRLIHAAGMAWLADDDRNLRQEIGARVDLFVVYFRYMVDPADTSNGDLDISLTLPFGKSYPWQD